MFRFLMLLLRLSERVEWPLYVLSPFGPYNPFLRAHRRNPYDDYRRLRETAPVYRHRFLGTWFLTRYADVDRVLRSSAFSVNRLETPLFQRMKPFAGTAPDFERTIRKSLLMQDPPDHTRLRGLVNKAFTPRAVERLRPRVQALVDERVERLRAQGEFDLMRELAVPLPVVVICELLGVPADERERLKVWSDVLARIIDPLQAMGHMREIERVFEEARGYFEALFEDRRRAPREDLISALVAVEDEESRLDGTELLALVVLIMGAGHETTTNLIGNAVVALLRHPHEWRRLQDDPSLVPAAVEEILRYDSPVQVTDRIALEPVEIGRIEIPRGALVATFLGAANRDPERFPEPDRLDVTRADTRHVSFGRGAHACLGAGLARLEAEIALGSLLARLPDLSGDVTEIDWARSLVLRGPRRLPLRAKA